MTGVLSCFGLCSCRWLRRCLRHHRVSSDASTQEIGARIRARRLSRRRVRNKCHARVWRIVLTGLIIGELLTAGLTVVAGAMQEGIGELVSNHIVVGLCGSSSRLRLLPASRARRAWSIDSSPCGMSEKLLG